MSQSPAACSAGASSPAKWACSTGARDAAGFMRSREATPSRLARRSSWICLGQTIGERRRRCVTGSARDGAHGSALPALWEGGWALLGCGSADLGVPRCCLRLGGAATPVNIARTKVRGFLDRKEPVPLSPRAWPCGSRLMVHRFPLPQGNLPVQYARRFDGSCAACSDAGRPGAWFSRPPPERPPRGLSRTSRREHSPMARASCQGSRRALLPALKGRGFRAGRSP